VLWPLSDALARRDAPLPVDPPGAAPGGPACLPGWRRPTRKKSESSIRRRPIPREVVSAPRERWRDNEPGGCSWRLTPSVIRGGVMTNEKAPRPDVRVQPGSRVSLFTHGDGQNDQRLHNTVSNIHYASITDRAIQPGGPPSDVYFQRFPVIPLVTAFSHQDFLLRTPHRPHRSRFQFQTPKTNSS